MILIVRTGDKLGQRDVIARLIAMQYNRNEADFSRGSFRVRGDTIDIFPAEHAELAMRIELFDDEIESLQLFDPLTGRVRQKIPRFTVYPSSPLRDAARHACMRAIETIKAELRERLEFFHSDGKLVEAQRLEQRTRFDLEMLQEMGFCKGIENYSRHFSGAAPGEPPPTLVDYLPPDALMLLDEIARADRPAERHVQRRPGAQGQPRRLRFPAAVGARQPAAQVQRVRDARCARRSSCRPRRPTTRRTHAGQVVEQLVRPTGLVDPEIEVRPARTQVDDVLQRDQRAREAGDRVLVTVLTKRMAEQLTEFLADHGVKVRYLHSDIDTVERVEIIRDLRLGHVRRAGRHQPAARRAGHSGSVAGRDSRRRQGRLPARRALADPDHRPGGAQRERQGDSLRRQGHRLDEAARSTKPSGGAPSRSRTTWTKGITPRGVIKRIKDIIDGVYNVDDARAELKEAADAREVRGHVREAAREGTQAARKADDGARQESRIREGRADPRPIGAAAAARVRRERRRSLTGVD